jgi:hypothetical protein
VGLGGVVLGGTAVGGAWLGVWRGGTAVVGGMAVLPGRVGAVVGVLLGRGVGVLSGAVVGVLLGRVVAVDVLVGAVVGVLLGVFVGEFVGVNVLVGGSVPVPFKVILCGVSAALSAMLTLPVRAPPAVGVKLMVMLHDCPAFNVAPEHVSLVRAKSPLSVTELIINGLAPVLVTAMVCGPLVVPTSCGPKVSVAGFRLTAGWSTIRLWLLALPGATATTPPRGRLGTPGFGTICGVSPHCKRGPSP